MPATQQPEKITSLQPSWNTGTQMFDVPLKVDYAVATPPENGAFSVTSRLVIKDPSGTEVGRLTSDPVDVPPASGRGGAGVSIPPVSVAWDRSPGPYTGPAVVSGTVELRDPSGGLVSSSTVAAKTLSVA